jgi:endonuclease YncB( thermonuclease family)
MRNPLEKLATAFAIPLVAGVSGSVRISAPVRVIGGDKFDYGGTRVRIADIDTPEVLGQCPEETGWPRAPRNACAPCSPPAPSS